jgi:23S rRNA U2552 (ribose-2'-O)-methylase RlmE/FtsJ
VKPEIKTMEQETKKIFEFANHENDHEICNHEKIIDIINLQLHYVLSRYKNLIESHYKNRKWDKFKKISNKYELIFGCVNNKYSTSKYVPVSRSFFKLWEILFDFDILQKTPINATFIADGPGGFIEAFTKYRDQVNNISTDSIYGITLISDDPSVPKWKLQKKLLDKYNINLLTGVDGTGSIYNIENTKNFVETIGVGQSTLITADGGFDFSHDFNSQENQSFHLILCEIFLALQIQKNKGTFILKMFDICNEETICMLYMLYMLYDKIYIIKPYSSRPANSEKYIVCSGYKGIDKDIVNHILDIIENNTDISTLFKVPLQFKEQLLYYNFNCVLLQIINIEKTIESINNKHLNINTVIEYQMHKANEYYSRYNL